MHETGCLDWETEKVSSSCGLCCQYRNMIDQIVACFLCAPNLTVFFFFLYTDYTQLNSLANMAGE